MLMKLFRLKQHKTILNRLSRKLFNQTHISKNELPKSNESPNNKNSKDPKEIRKSSTNSETELKFITFDKNGIPIIKKNYYDALGVKDTANLKQIRENYLKIAKLYHPDKNPKALEYFTHISTAYSILSDDQKRACYDDDILNQAENFFIIKIWKYKVNVLYVFCFSVVFFISKYIYDYYTKRKMNYICPLGEEKKFEVDKLKFKLNENEKEDKIEIIETNREQVENLNLAKLDEDDEYEYYIVEDDSDNNTNQDKDKVK